MEKSRPATAMGSVSAAEIEDAAPPTLEIDATGFSQPQKSALARECLPGHNTEANNSRLLPTAIRAVLDEERLFATWCNEL